MRSALAVCSKVLGPLVCLLGFVLSTVIDTGAKLMRRTARLFDLDAGGSSGPWTRPMRPMWVSDGGSPPGSCVR